MALDFFIPGTEAAVYALDDHDLRLFSPILQAYQQRTGLSIDRDADASLQPENMRILLQIIARFQLEADLNRNREQTGAIFRLAGLLTFCVGRGLTLRFRGD